MNFIDFFEITLNLPQIEVGLLSLL